MLLWLVLASLTAAVVAALLHPLMSRGDAGSPADGGAAAVYRHQLDEIDAEAARGLIGAEEAEASRREIARRLIASAGDTHPPNAAASGVTAAAAGVAAVSPRRVAAALGLMFPAAALVFYLAIGAPHLPSQRLEARRAVATEAAQARAEVDRLVTAVEARLKQHPEDGRGWDVIAPVYLRLGRFPDAAVAYRRALEIEGRTPRRLAGLAEALILEAQGLVTPEARSSLEALLEIDPVHAQARLWLALAAEQDGRLADAGEVYDRLLAEAPADAPWRAFVDERRRLVAAGLAAGERGAPPPAADAGAPRIDRPLPAGPTPEDMAIAEGMTEAERSAMVEGMVSGLSDRLDKDGRDLAGWQRLIRALAVLGRKDEALAALDRAREALSDEPTSLATLADLARDLGLGT